MKKLVYVYSELCEKVHTKFISSKTMLREANGADKVEIYEYDEIWSWELGNSVVTGKYITTIALN